MADITKTNHKGLGLPKHFDPSMEQMKKNMEVIDDILQKAVPNDLTSITDANAEPNINTLTETGRYLAKSGATGYPVSGYAGIVDVFRAGTYILQEWRSINSPTYTYRRYSTNSGSSWNSWIKDWNANNDGSGSGLDADTLDGVDSSNFFRIRGTTTDFNSATSEGKWRITNTTNAPYTGCTDWVCVVYHLGNTTNELYQLAYEECNNVPTSISGEAVSSYSNMPLMFIRKRINSSTWSSWQVMWHSGIDGASSGMNADLLDGYHASSFVLVSNLLSAIKNIDGSGSGIDADLLDGVEGSAYLKVTSLLTELLKVDGSGTELDADLLDGKHASAFAQTNTTAYTDFNSVPLAVGMYGVNGTATNAPVSSTGTYSVIVIKTSTGYMMLAVNTIDSNIYRRHTTGAWSTSTVWTKVGSGTGLQKASATFVTSSGVADSTSNYLKITREEASSELNAGDVIAVTVDTLSSSALTYSYIYSVDSLSFKKQIYKPNGSTQVQPVQIPKYFLLEYNGSTFNIVSPLSDSNFVISENEPSDTSSHPTGTVWFRYYFDN